MIKRYFSGFVSANKRGKARFITIWAIRILSLMMIVFACISLGFYGTKTNYSYYVNMILQSLVLIGLSIIPVIVEKIWRVRLPFMIVMIFLFMSLCSFFLGEIADFYVRFEWWDDFLHTFAGLYMTACAFFLLSVLNQRRDVPYKSSPGFVVFFAFCVALAFECLWEMIEYSIDEFFGSNMQRAFISKPFVENGPVTDINDPLFNALVGRDALKDTMGDIFEVVAGSIVTCILGYIGLKHDEKIKRIFKLDKKKENDDLEELNDSLNDALEQEEIENDISSSSIENDNTN